LWDRFDVQEGTLQEFIDHFKAQGLNVSMISSGVSSTSMQVSSPF
jgi:ubiquitin-activating enzyme E1